MENKNLILLAFREIISYLCIVKQGNGVTL